jgi:amino acid transporter
MNPPTHTASLRRAIGRGGFFTLAFGAVVGSGWVVVLGEWLTQAGPGGSAAGFLIGGGVMALVALCYGELAARLPTAGGEFLYTLHAFGEFPAFVVGWFLTFAQISVCAFEGIALAWLVSALLPGISLGPAYTVAGNPVTWDALLIGLSSALIVGYLHLRGAHAAIRFQKVATYGFIAICLVLIASGFLFGSFANLQPLLASSPGQSPLAGVLWIFASSAYFLNGWQAAVHAIEERREQISVRTAVVWMVAAIGAAASFYACIIFACSMAMPRSELIGRELPAVAALSALGAGGILGSVVLVGAIISLSKTWSACAWIGTRLLFAQGRHGLLPRFFGSVDARFGAPRPAIVFVTALSMIGIALGRSAIVPIVDTLSICVALSIILCLIALLRERRKGLLAPDYTVPGGTVTIWAALLSATAMVGIAIVRPLLIQGRMPIELLLLLAWGAIGAIAWFTSRSARGQHTAVLP